MSQQFQDPQMQEFFSTLPIHVQETIKQSGTQIENEAQLRRLAQQLTQGHSGQ